MSVISRFNTATRRAVAGKEGGGREGGERGHPCIFIRDDRQRSAGGSSKYERGIQAWGYYAEGSRWIFIRSDEDL